VVQRSVFRKTRKGIATDETCASRSNSLLNAEPLNPEPLNPIDPPLESTIQHPKNLISFAVYTIYKLFPP
jgi:hypothetical protein